ncbi:MAG: hypothetical protein ACHQ4J_01095 [Candidatus Binatia bacterium]
MRKHTWLIAAAGAVVLAALMASIGAAADLPADVKTELANSKYVYIATTRKDGKLGKPAEIWFPYHNGAVYVASPPTTWRVRRIKAGRTAAKISVGKPDGPSFMAAGAVVNEPDVYPILFETYAKKYPDGWKSFEEKFRGGLKDGSRVLIKFTPQDAAH